MIVRFQRKLTIDENLFFELIKEKYTKRKITPHVLRNQRISGTPEIAKQFLSGMKWNPEWLDFYDNLTHFNSFFLRDIKIIPNTAPTRLAIKS